MEDIFLLKYDGLSATMGEMDAYDVADALRGFADFSRRVSEGVYGRKMEIRTSVRDIRHGSVEIEFLTRILSSENMALLVTMYEHLPSVLKVIGECIKLFKHLQGQKPASIKKAENGSVLVENNSGTILVFNQSTVNIALDQKTGRSVQSFIKKPLGRSADTLVIKADGREIANINREESQYFFPIDSTDLLTETKSEIYLTIATTVFEGHAQWRFHDGRDTFSARIEDQVFLDRVERGEERFGKGDALLVRLRAMQKRANGRLVAEYVIEDVIKHMPTSELQGKLL
ncbi:hypothetical protein GE253_17185 [Niveispirillum sp. SYP-B3756]|uniref:hypothetical protein n=1 Tax=Niveispirillum sp. SYP-B3756 TaxID=2662178 RepID=UPI001291FFED|nr:hypothetical protein [Niveispirillum sp. SYP-B3756]MQP67064.1 hypothetical protein [Niveispirillum sp. SYP-B3756]